VDPLLLVAVLENALWLLCAFLISRLARYQHLDREVCVVFPIFLFGATEVVYGSYNDLFANGMESSLAITSIIGFMTFAAQKDLFGHSLSSRDLIVGSILLALVLFSRLDAAFILVPIVTIHFLTLLPRGSLFALKQIFTLILLPFSLLLLYCGFNYIRFGLVLPVSGLAKSIGGPYFNLHALLQFLNVEAITTSPS